MISINDIGTAIAIYDHSDGKVTLNHEVDGVSSNLEIEKAIKRLSESGKKIELVSVGDIELLIVSADTLDDKSYFIILDKIADELKALEPFLVINEELDIILNTIHYDILITDWQ